MTERKHGGFCFKIITIISKRIKLLEEREYQLREERKITIK
jgi:hypothetical protein